ncbi:hypothetical protein FA95DRAFT_1613828, partial [Auriscalpium vulgare]
MGSNSAQLRFRADSIHTYPASHHRLPANQLDPPYRNHMKYQRSKPVVRGTGSHTPTQPAIQSQLVNPTQNTRLGAGSAPGSLSTAVSGELTVRGRVASGADLIDALFSPENFIEKNAAVHFNEIMKELDNESCFLVEGEEPPIGPLTARASRLRMLMETWNEDENGACEFLNALGDVVGEFGDQPSPRLFSAVRSGEAAQGASEHFKPDAAVVLRRLAAIFRYWQETEALLEFTKRSTNAGLGQTMQEKMALKFRTQFGLRHVIGVGIHDKKITAYYMDRSGLLTATCPMTSDLLVRIVGTLLFASAEFLGRDTTVGLTPKLSTASITMGNLEFEFVRYLSQDLSVRGRGLNVALVKHGNVYFVIRDFWADVSREITGAGILRECETAGVTGVLRLLGSEVVPIKDPSLAAKVADIRAKQEQPPETREHRRELLGPMCRMLHSFQSQEELVQSLMDITQCLKELRELGYVHREVTLESLGIVDPVHMDTVKRFKPQTSERPLDLTDLSPEPAFVPAASDHAPRQPACGVVLDVDHMMHVEREDKIPIADAPRPETLAFVSLELIETPATTPTEKHDLESIFWIFIWLCSTYRAPTRPREIGQEQVWTWCKPAYSEQQRMAIHRNKAGSLGRGPAGVVAEFSPEFRDLQDLAGRLFNLLFPDGSPSRAAWQVSLSSVQHADFIAAFQETLDKLYDANTPGLTPAFSAMDVIPDVSEKRQFATAFPSPLPFEPVPVSPDVVRAGSVVTNGILCESIVTKIGETLQVVEEDGGTDNTVPAAGKKRARGEKQPGKYFHFADKAAEAQAAAEAKAAEAAEAHAAAEAKAAEAAEAQALAEAAEAQAAAEEQAAMARAVQREAEQAEQ